MPLSRINNPFLSSSGAGNASITSPAANTIAFSTATTERMRIRSDGNTFIGVASAVWDERLGIRPVTGTGQVGLGVYSPSTTYASSLIRVQSENTTGTAYNLFEGRGQGGGVKILIDGNGLVDLKNGQIKFPATQNASADANTLDDYEEGLWTPTMVATGTSFTYGAAYGTYVKVGSFVMAQFYLRVTAYTGPNNNTAIGGLPFTAANINALSQYGTGLWSTTSVAATPLVQNNQATAEMWKQGTSVTIFTASEVINAYFVGCLTYRAA